MILYKSRNHEKDDQSYNSKLLSVCIIFLGIARDHVWCESDYNRRCICTWRKECHYHEPPDENGLDVSVELSDEIQLPQIGKNLPQSQSQKRSWIW